MLFQVQNDVIVSWAMLIWEDTALTDETIVILIKRINDTLKTYKSLDEKLLDYICDSLSHLGKSCYRQEVKKMCTESLITMALYYENCGNVLARLDVLFSNPLELFYASRCILLDICHTTMRNYNDNSFKTLLVLVIE